MMSRDLIVRSRDQRATHGVATLGPLSFQCGLGRSGLTHCKREGDGATPIGRWTIAGVLFRPDRLHGFYGSGALREAIPLRPNDGWCDAQGDRNYNRPVHHPYPVSAEKLWRDDHLYDVIVLLRHNWRPRTQGGGSAIFMHLAGEDADGSIAPTAGCVSLRRRDLAVVLDRLGPRSAVRVVA